MKTAARIEELRRALRLEHEEERRRWEEERRGTSRRDRIAAGIAVADLEPLDESWGLGGRLLLTVGREGRAISERFERGAMVELRPQREDEPVAVATIARRRTYELTLAFDRPPPETFSRDRAFIELAPNTVTHRRALANLDAVAQMESGAERRRRDAWFGDAPPRVNESAPPQHSGLNPEQAEALQRALEARDLHAIHGPPGTGKSTVLAALMKEEASRGSRIIATAASNAAVDHLLELALTHGLEAIRVGHPARVSESLRAHTLDDKLENHPDRAMLDELRDEAFELGGYARRQRRQGRSRERHGRARDASREARALLKRADEHERLLTRALLDEAQVVCATLATLTGPTLVGRRFDLAVFDEATQATEPLALATLRAADRVVLAGDPQQLPPTVLSPAAAQAGLAVSAIERVIEVHAPEVRTLLREQYRMSAAIMEFPSKHTYAGALRAHPSVAERRLDVTATDARVPFLFVDTAGKGFAEEPDADTASLRNPGEGELVVQHAHALLAAGLAPSQLALVTPYAAQVLWLRSRAPHPEVEIDTVDAFQGREKDAILVSLVRSNDAGALGFLKDLRRLNVSLTRARRHVVVFGDSATLSTHPTYAALIEHAMGRDAYRSAWAWP